MILTCDDAGDYERQDDELQHSHEELTRKAEVELLQLGQRTVVTDSYAQPNA